MRILKDMRKKLKSKRGFTLVEMLAALLVVVMMSLMMSVGASVGAQVQREATFVAESDILASTLNTAVGDMLRYSVIKPVDDVDTTNAMTTEDESGVKKSCLFDNDSYGIVGGKILLNSYTDSKGRVADRVAVFYQKTELIEDPVTHVKEPSAPVDKTHYLVSHGIYTTLIVKNFKVEYNATNATFHLTYTIKESDRDTALTKKVDTYFRAAND